MIAMMMATLTLFFAFVINTGMLVHAKINLQNAADMAAYAGAAVQARQLTQISLLNYEMRRQYKKFLFRYYVIGNMAQHSSPRAAGIPGPRNWSPDGDTSGGGFDYKVPTVCVIFSPSDNYCHLKILPKINYGALNFPLDKIGLTLKDQLAKLEQIRQAGCNSIGKSNIQILLYWLWNTDPQLTAIDQALNAAAQQNDPNAIDMKQKLSRMKGLVQGLGLIPRELLLRMRISTVADYINFAPQENVTLALANQLRTQGDVAARERTIQAFFSAYNSLGAHTFDDDESIIMEEMLPKGSNGANLIKLDEISLDKFDTYASDMTIQNGSCPPTTNQLVGTTANDCVPCLTPVTSKGKVPVGVYKNPSALTYYAIRLKAKAKLMFMPSFAQDAALVAYSAAQPFGSRIGPAPPMLSPSDFLRQGQSDASCNAAGVTGCAGFIPSLGVKAGETAGRGLGWDSNDVIGAMAAPMLKNATTLDLIGPADIQRGYDTAMAPNPAEQGRYNILTADAAPAGGKAKTITEYFSDGFDDSGVYAFWAPIFSSDKQSTLKDAIGGLIDDFVDVRGASPAAFSDSFKTALKAGLEQYSQDLQANKGEDGESLHIMRIRDPYNTRPSTGSREAIVLPADLYLDPAKPKDVKTSWNDTKDSKFEAAGRTGYSVKFVSFRTLISPGNATSNGHDPWSNADADLKRLPGTEYDLDFLQH